MAGKPEPQPPPLSAAAAAAAPVLVYVSGGGGGGYQDGGYQAAKMAMPGGYHTAKMVPVSGGGIAPGSGGVTAPGSGGGSAKATTTTFYGFRNVVAPQPPPPPPPPPSAVDRAASYQPLAVGRQQLVPSAFMLKQQNQDDGPLPPNSFLAVIPNGNSATEVVRCDSVRSESSCSSLSSSSEAALAAQPANDMSLNGGGSTVTTAMVRSVVNPGGDNVLGGATNAVGCMQLVQSNVSAAVGVPTGWKRLLSSGVVIYVSPSNTALRSLEQVKTYLQTQGTCKCGLECPLNCDIVFNFDPKVASKPWSAGAPPNHLTGLCNHKRKAIALSQTTSQYQDIKKLEAAVRRKKRKTTIGGVAAAGVGAAVQQHQLQQLQQYGVVGGNSAASVSQILAQRERERNSKDSDQQHAWNDGMPMSIPAGSSPVIIGNHMIVNPAANGRVQYPPGYHEHSGTGNAPMMSQQQQQPPSQYFRYSPATCNPASQQNSSSGIIENDTQMMCNNQNSMNPNQSEFSGASNAFNHPPNVVMTSSMEGCDQENSPIQNTNNNQMMIQDNSCTNGGHSVMIGGHNQQHVQNFMPQHNQQRMSVACSDGNNVQHEHCNQGSKPHPQQQQQQVFMPNQDSINMMNHQLIHHPHQMQPQSQSQSLQQNHHQSSQQQQQNQNQQILIHHHHHQQQQHHQQQIQLQQQQQQMQQQQQIQNQHHQQQFQHQMQPLQNQYQNNHHSATVPIQHNALPSHIINTSSSSPRPSNSHVICQSAQSVSAPHQNVDPNRINPQFHLQQQHQQQVHHNHRQQSGHPQNEQVKSVQHVHVVDGSKVSCNQQATKTNVGGTQVLFTSGLNNRGIVCDNNYSAMQPTNRNDILQQHQQSSTPTAMILQTSQGQVMIPTAQAMASGMLVQSQPNNQNSQNSQVHSMNIGQSPAVVVQGSHGSTVVPNTGHINSQGQATMVLHQNQNSQSLVSQQGLQVQTVVGGQHHMPTHQGVHHQQHHHIIPSSSSNVIPAGSGINQQQRNIPPWQQNKQQQIQNQQLNQSVMINNQQQAQQQPQHIIQQHPNNPYERVPPLHHQQSQQIPVWQQHLVEDNIKKKFSKVQNKTNLVKKQRSPYSNDNNHHNASGNSEPCPNVDVRHLHNDQKNNSQPMIFNNVPSFMEDPSGYLAQQTALLNSTISRQTGAHSSNMICHSPCGSQNHNSPDQNSSGHMLVNVPTSASSPLNNQGVPVPSNVMQSKQQSTNQVVRNNQLMNTVKVYRSNSVSSTGSTSYQNQSQPGTPDSSDVTVEKSHSQQSRNVADSNNLQGTVHIIHNSGKQIDDSPVTSSTFIENRGHHNSNSLSDSRGPIQGGTVSTSNRSPVEAVHRIQPPDITSPGERATPTSSTQICHSSPESPTTQNILVSVSSPFVNHSSPIFLTSHPNVVISRPNDLRHHHQQQQQLSINIQVQDVAGNRIPAVVTTMASGHTVSSNTITSVLAGRANTATVSVNNPSTQPSQTATPPVLTNQPSQVSHNQVAKSPLEMVQSVVSSIQVPNVSTGQTETTVLKQATGHNLPPGHILVSSNGQLLVANTNGGPPAILSPQQNIAKIGGSSPMPPMSGNSIVTTVTGAVTQMIPAVGVTQQVLGQPTVLVNALPAPLLFQPGVMTVDGTMNAVQIPHLAVATSNTMLQSGQMMDESRMQQSSNGAFSPRTQQALLSPDSANGKRKANLKKRKVSPQTVANMLHIAAQQTSPTAGATGMVVQQPQPQQSYNNSAPMLQALTILPSKSGHFGGTQQLIATTNVLQPLNLVQNFPTIQQFIVPAGLGGMVMATGDGTATLLPEGVQLNVLTPVQGPTGTVFGHAGGQSILTTGPAGMVIRTPNNNHQNTAKVQHGGGQQFIANSPNQFLMQSSPAATFSGQLSPMLANVSPTSQPIHTFNPTAAGTVQRGQNRQPQEFIQCGQTLMVPCTIAQASPAQNTTVVQQNTTIVQQQTTMVSNNQNLDHNQGPATSSSSSSSSLSLNQHNFILNNGDGKQGNFIITTDKQNQGNFILSPNPDNKGTHIILNNISPSEKQTQQCSGFLISQSTDKSTGQICDNFILTNSSLSEKGGNFILSSAAATTATTNLIQQQQQQQQTADKMAKFAKHSVSTQTAANQQQQQNNVQGVPHPVALIVATSNTFSQTSTSTSYTGSPPDTTTHSPVDVSGSSSSSQSPGLQLQSEMPSSSMVVGSTDENCLSSPTSTSDAVGGGGGGGGAARSQPMVQCVSSSNEQDSPTHEWSSKEANTSPSPAIFSPPPANVDANYGRGGSGVMKTVSVSSYVESSTVQQYDEERLHKHSADESLSHQVYQYHGMSRVPKRKHSQMCSDNDARIHTSTLSPEDEDDDSGSQSGGSETEDGGGRGSKGGGSPGSGGGGGPGAGDLVWGAARGFPSWPGKLVGPAPTAGRVWVRWFGAGHGPLSEVEPHRLKTLSQGLEAHHRARKKFRKSRKLNSQLENAIQEAMAELDRMSETPQQGPPRPPQSQLCNNNMATTVLETSAGSASRLRRTHR